MLAAKTTAVTDADTILVIRMKSPFRVPTLLFSRLMFVKVDTANAQWCPPLAWDNLPKIESGPDHLVPIFLARTQMKKRNQVVWPRSPQRFLLEASGRLADNPTRLQ
jgi:hypothetical protein